jgi:hypothetical protein
VDDMTADSSSELARTCVDFLWRQDGTLRFAGALHKVLKFWNTYLACATTEPFVGLAEDDRGCSF